MRKPNGEGDNVALPFCPQTMDGVWVYASVPEDAKTRQQCELADVMGLDEKTCTVF